MNDSVVHPSSPHSLSNHHSLIMQDSDDSVQYVPQPPIVISSDQESHPHVTNSPIRPGASGSRRAPTMLSSDHDSFLQVFDPPIQPDDGTGNIERASPPIAAETHVSAHAEMMVNSDDVRIGMLPLPLTC